MDIEKKLVYPSKLDICYPLPYIKYPYNRISTAYPSSFHNHFLYDTKSCLLETE